MECPLCLIVTFEQPLTITIYEYVKKMQSDIIMYLPGQIDVDPKRYPGKEVDKLNANLYDTPHTELFLCK